MPQDSNDNDNDHDHDHDHDQDSTKDLMSRTMSVHVRYKSFVHFFAVL